MFRKCVQVALAIRTYTTGHPPAQPFVIVSLASILVLVTGWRAAFTAAFPNDRKVVAGDRKGSLLELFQVSRLNEDSLSQQTVRIRRVWRNTELMSLSRLSSSLHPWCDDGKDSRLRHVRFCVSNCG